MSAIKYDLVIEKGGVLRVPMRLLTGGAAYDLSGCAARMQVRGDLDTVIDDLSTGNGRIVIEPADGRVTLIFPATVTAAIEAERGRYDLEIIPASGEADAWKLARGSVRYVAEVTR